MKKGVFTKIESVPEDGDVVLDNGIALSASHACRSIRLAYAMTYSGAQGLTLQGRVRLDCTESARFSIKHLYVGASRATASRLLEVA